MPVTKIISIVATAVVFVILGQTLFFKFSGATESVELFTRLGLEPYGRIGIGVAELIAILLLVIPRTSVYGALLSLGLMAGALLSHVTKLGFAGEMGSLAALGAVAFVSSAVILWTLKDRVYQLVSIPLQLVQRKKVAS